MNKKAIKEGTVVSDSNPDGNDGSATSGLSSSAAATVEVTMSNAQWKKDETMLLQYIILNVADQRDTLVEDFSD